MRRRLPAGVRMYTGDDFNYAELIAGDGVGTTPRTGTATRCWASSTPSRRRRARRWPRWRAGDEARFHAILAPTVPLSRHIFRAPTRFYKTGVVFMAWLNGHQDHFVMVGGQQSTRSLPHLRELFRLADAAGLIERPGALAARACDTCWRCTESTPELTRLQRRPPLAVDQHRHGAQAARAVTGRCCRSWMPAPRAASAPSPLARPGGRRRPGGHGARREGARPRAVGLLPRRHVHLQRRRGPPGRARRQPARAGRGLRTRRRLPGAGGRRPARRAGRAGRAQGHRPARASRSPRAWRHCWRMPANAACRWPSNRCTRCTPPTAPASTRSSRRWTCATRWTRGAAAHSAWRWTPITSGGTPSSPAQIERAGTRAAAGLARLRLARAHHRPARGPRHDGRRRDRPPQPACRGRGAGLCRLQRGRDLLGAKLVAARRRRGARHLHRAPPQLRLRPPGRRHSLSNRSGLPGSHATFSAVRRTRRTLNALTISTPCSSASASQTLA